MGVKSDLDKGVTYGDADGPDMFVDQLGIVVPTFINPRTELLIGSATRYKRVSHHIPFNMRGFFTPSDWPEEYRKTIQYRTNEQGYVLCAGINTYGKAKDGSGVGVQCRAKAVNRTQFCRCHGGGLHPLDKKMSSKNVVAPPENRVKALDRPQKFLQGFLDISELTDEEVQGMFIYNDAGQKVSSMVLGMKLHQQLAQELHRRMNRFLQTKTASMLNVMVDIAESELVEPADRIKAAVWVAERTLGKTPEVIMHGKVEAPYEAIFESIDAGSREDYRQKDSSARLSVGGNIHEIIDAEVDDLQDSDNDSSADWHSRRKSDEIIVDEEDQPDDQQTVEYAQRFNERHQEVDRQKEIKKARAKAKQRRFAARANGATTLTDMPWMIEWKFVSSGVDAGNFRMKLVCPDEQTEARIDKVNKSNADALDKADAYRRNHVA